MKMQIKGFDELTKKLDKMSKKAKKYDGTHKVKLPFTEEEWKKMDYNQQQFYIKKAQDKFINQAMNDIFS